MNAKPNILFTSTFTATFIREDAAILKTHCNVTEINSRGLSAIFKYFFAVRKVDITFSWFASVYSSYLVFLTKLFGKKSIVVIGGVDVAKEKEYRYGIWNSWWKSKIVAFGMKNADAILSVDESLRGEAMHLAGYDGHNIRVVPTGYNFELWKPGDSKKDIVLSVGSVNEISRFKKKGFDILFTIASQMSDVQFVIIGIKDTLKIQFRAPENVQCYPTLTQEKLLSFFQTSKVYCQLSRHEGLPNALCEAMLCGCIPVGSNRFGIPNGIGDTGFIVDLDKPDEIIHAIRAALREPLDAGLKARQRIMEKFPLEQRRRQLYNTIQAMIK